jgi:branched-chain amino acid transport system substrate-binding protein
VTTLTGKFMKQQGVTTVGALGYSISPTSAEAAKATGVSAQAVGLKVGYINSKFPFGSTNVQPEALAMKKAGVDGFTPATDPNTSYALITALRDLNANIKVALLPGVGYGSDLLQAGAGTLKAAQNVYYSLSFQPIEMQTDATKAFQKALQDVGYSKADHPGTPVYNGYASMLLLGEGLKAANGDLSHAGIIKGLSTVTSFDAGGLTADHPVNPSTHNSTDGAQLCAWVVKLVGDTFELVKDADPVCGEIIPGKTVSP